MSIFKGKGKRYNEYVLESILRGGQKTTMQIAESIAAKTGGHRLTVFSIIDRKGGALNRLSKPEKEFINKNENGEWYLTFKGGAAALTLVETRDLQFFLPRIQLDLEEVDVEKNFEILRLILGRFYKEEIIRELVDWFKSGDYWIALKRKTEQLRDKGVNIEEMTEKEFTYTVLPQMVIEWSNQKFFKALPTK